MRRGLILLCLAGGCASPGQPAVKVEPPQVVTRADVSAEVAPVIAAVASLDKKVSRVEQSGSGNSTRIDNSTVDRWAVRLLVSGCVLLGLTYPLGKLLWLMSGRLKRRLGGRKCQEPTVSDALCPGPAGPGSSAGEGGAPGSPARRSTAITPRTSGSGSTPSTPRTRRGVGGSKRRNSSRSSGRWGTAR